MKKDCVFCDIKKIKSNVTDYGDFISFEPLNPVTPGHILIVPKQHVSDFTEDQNVTANAIKLAANIANIKGGSYNLITSKGKEATQSVFHLHIHLVPRIENDGLLLPWSSPSLISDRE